MTAVRILFGLAGKLLIAVVLGGLLGGALARFSPGFAVDERELDARFSDSSIKAIRDGRSEGANFLHFYFGLLKNAAKGDLGHSTTLDRPIAELLKDRLPVTLREIAWGLSIASISAIFLAVTGEVMQNRLLIAAVESLGSLLLCIPVALTGFLCVLLRAQPWCAIALCTFPHLFRYTANLLANSFETQFVCAARARGVSAIRLYSAHIFLPCAPDLLAALGMAVSIAFGAAIPVEFATETPGVGQLAWQAASSRDLPLLCLLTMFTVTLVLGANGLGEIIQGAANRE